MRREKYSTRSIPLMQSAILADVVFLMFCLNHLAEFHAACVDTWLTSWRSFCPVCKGDAGGGIPGPPASETTPLFSSAVHLRPTSSSVRSSVGASPPRAINRRPWSQSISRIYSFSHSPNTQRFYRNSSATSISGSIADLASMSSPSLGTLHLGSTHTLVGNHLSPPVSIIYAPAHIYSHSGYGSPSPRASLSYTSNSGYGSSSGRQHYLGESGPSLSTMAPQTLQQQQSQLCHDGDSETSLNLAGAQSFWQSSYLRHCGDSDASLSAMASSGQSMPGCWWWRWAEARFFFRACKRQRRRDLWIHHEACNIGNCLRERGRGVFYVFLYIITSIQQSWTLFSFSGPPSFRASFPRRASGVLRQEQQPYNHIWMAWWRLEMVIFLLVNTRLASLDPWWRTSMACSPYVVVYWSVARAWMSTVYSNL
jgi:hypothetical protein